MRAAVWWRWCTVAGKRGGSLTEAPAWSPETWIVVGSLVSIAVVVLALVVSVLIVWVVGSAEAAERAPGTVSEWFVEGVHRAR